VKNGCGCLSRLTSAEECAAIPTVGFRDKKTARN
jgi:hypothetical protein